MNHELLDLTVVSPVYGCVGCLQRLVDEAKAAADELGLSVEVILVDDASPDAAWPTIVQLCLTRPWLRGIRLSRNFGQHAAISRGIATGRGTWTVVMDCDLQDPPSAIVDLYRHAVAGGYDVVFAQRINRQDRPTKRFLSWGFHKVLSWLTGVHQDESTANFGIYRRPVIDAVVAMPERDRTFPLMVRWVGFSQSTLPVQHAPRAEGRSAYSMRRMLKLALQVILGYSSKPLRIVAWCGLGAAAVSFAIATAALWLFFQGQIAVAGYTSIAASLWLLGGMILVGLGVVGLYVGQVFANVQGRPTSIIAESVGLQVAQSTSRDTLANQEEFIRWVR